MSAFMPNVNFNLSIKYPKPFDWGLYHGRAAMLREIGFEKFQLHERRKGLLYWMQANWFPVTNVWKL